MKNNINRIKGSYMIIEKSKIFVKTRLEDESSGHDWFHTLRVYNNALTIAKKENITQPQNLLIIELGSLFHDIADHKFGYTDQDRYQIINNFLSTLEISSDIIDHVIYIANNISFKKGTPLQNLEAQIVQDADRLDAIGAIGIARTFTYGGYKGRTIYDPDNHIDTISHFHEKLLVLKELFNTNSGKQIAQQRHTYMVQFLEQFHQECKELL